MDEELPTREIMERVRALERCVQRMQFDQNEREEWKAQKLQSLERRVSSSSSASLNSGSGSLSSASSLCSWPSSPTMQRSPRLAYSSSFKKPEVPSVFQMPLHYPKYSQAEYDTMPEWQLDRLLEEYGLPVMGTLVEKKQYAIGVFLWK
ncbi:hypothetical protein L7F22_024272 [Adiantum nelumboides]|nr:hypothetical protein [Adiantum nelumboides]